MDAATPQEAKKGGAEQDPSMEEILQSIKKIIAEDGTEVAAPNGATPAKAEEDVPGSDVLELTEVVPDEIPVEVPAAPASNDVLSQIDQAVGATEKPAAPTAPSAPVVAPAAAKSVAAPSSAPSDPMLSDSAAAAASASFNKLKRDDELPPVVTTPSPAFKSGTSVEDMVAAMLRPMIKEWLDTNLPAIVERIVDREVKRLTK